MSEETIKGNDFLKEVLEEYDEQRVNEILKKFTPACMNGKRGYLVFNLSKTVVFEILNRPNLVDKVFYFDLSKCAYEKLTKEIFSSTDYKSINIKRKAIVSEIYIASDEVMAFILKKILMSN